MTQPAATATASRPGEAAQREYERRKVNDERRVRERHPYLGGLAVKLRQEPQHLSAWSRGAKGERRVGRRLDRLASDSVRVLHDRRIPGSRANIDHLVVAASGVYVVDTKRYRGKPERRDRGDRSRKDLRLYVRGRDRSRLVDSLRWQVGAVLDVVGERAPVHPVLCFVDADWRLLDPTFTIGGVFVCWPRALCRRVRSAGPGTIDQIEELEERLRSRFLPA